MKEMTVTEKEGNKNESPFAIFFEDDREITVNGYHNNKEEFASMISADTAVYEALSYYCMRP